MLKKLILFIIILTSSKALFASEPIPGKLLIKLMAGTNIETVVSQIPYQVLKYIYRRSTFKNNDPEIEKTYALRFSESEDIKDVAEAVKKITGVKWTSFDYVIEQPPEPIKAKRIIDGRDYALNAFGVYLLETEHRYIRYIPVQEQIMVAVIDSGIKYTHKDLNEAIYINPGEIQGNGIDDDHNGLVDDYMGWDFMGYSDIGGNNDPFPFTPHATLVAGIIGGKKDDQFNICGINPDCKILNLKFGASLEDASYAVRYAADMGAKIINCSFNTNPDSTFNREAFAYAISQGCIVVVAAGNQGQEVSTVGLYPQNYPDMTLVTSHTGDEQGVGIRRRSGFANYGTEVSFAAFGYDVHTTGVDETKPDSDTGTSLAAPIVAGILSRIWANSPSLTRQQVLDKAIQYTVRLDSGTGYGRIDSEALAKSYVTVQTKHVDLNVGGKKGILEVDYVTGGGTTKRFAEYYYFGGRKYSIHREM